MARHASPMAGFAASASVVSAQPVQGESLAANRQGALAVDRLFGRDEEDAGDEAAESLFQSAWFDDYFGERSPDNLSRHSFDALALTIAVAVMRQAQPAEPERNRPGHPALRS